MKKQQASRTHPSYQRPVSVNKFDQYMKDDEDIASACVLIRDAIKEAGIDGWWDWVGGRDQARKLTSLFKQYDEPLMDELRVQLGLLTCTIYSTFYDLGSRLERAIPTARSRRTTRRSA